MPDWEIRLWGEYFAREPSPEEKLEYAIANLTAIFVQCNSKKGAKKSKLSDYLLFRKVWEYQPNSGNEDVDDDIRLIMASFASRLVIQHR